jgi:hypothetical protein
MQARKCGDCQLCCKLLAVRELDKLTGVRCEHQRHKKGCHSYPARPESCRLWNCRWVLGQLPDGMSRPDRAHYIVDMMPDFVTVDKGDGPQNYQVVQIWVDPAYPGFHQDRHLLAYLGEQWRRNILGIARFGAKLALTMVPPGFTGPDQNYWTAVQGTSTSEHTPEEIMNAMRGVTSQFGEMAERLKAAVC